MSFLLLNQAVMRQLPAVIAHPFNQQLQNGTLSSRNFYFFMQQDFLYLKTFSKVLIHLAQRMASSSVAMQLNSLASYINLVEKDLHHAYLSQVQLPPQAFFSQVNAPVPCHAVRNYIAHLQTHAACDLPVVALAALYPCYKLYGELALHFVSMPKTPNNPYQAWINSYGDPCFTKCIMQFTQILQESCSLSERENSDRMIRAALESCRLEIAFWDEAMCQEPRLLPLSRFPNPQGLIAAR